MAGMSGIWESLNEKSWPLLDFIEEKLKLPLATFFDDNGIPPIMFPISILILIIVLLLLLGGGGGGGMPEAFCGNDICDRGANETFATCPEDCPQPEVSGSTVTVNLNEVPDCSLSVELHSSDGPTLRTQTGRQKQFVYPGIDSPSVYVVLKDSNGKTQDSSPTLVNGDTSITMTIANKLCKGSTPEIGVLRLTIKDQTTGSNLNGVSVSIAEMQGYQVSNYVVQNRIVNNGFRDFQLEPGQYAVFAQKSGYQDYDGSNNPVTVTIDNPASLSITMNPVNDYSVLYYIV
jgi:hypothetical protein